jgi:hypothetical protein
MLIEKILKNIGPPLKKKKEKNFSVFPPKKE